MKRSTAIKEIQEYLDKNSVHQISPQEILKLVESLGMLPPTVNIITENGEHQKINEWLPERFFGL